MALRRGWPSCPRFVPEADSAHDRAQPILVIVWMLTSCGFDGFYYTYVTTQEVVAVVGVTWLVATYIHQEDLNRMIQASH